MRHLALSLFLATLAGAATAHTGHGGGSFAIGFLHPILGWDHLAAMVAVGLWGAFLGAPAIWVLPVAFPLDMALGGALALAGAGLPAVETGIAASALVIGVAVALAARPPLWIASLVVGVFAVFHGHAHGAEMPKAANSSSGASSTSPAAGSARWPARSPAPGSPPSASWRPCCRPDRETAGGAPGAKMASLFPARFQPCSSQNFRCDSNRFGRPQNPATRSTSQNAATPPIA